MTDDPIDMYAPLSHHRAYTTRTGVAPTWVPADQQRRLTAYQIRAAYMANVARTLRTGDPDRDSRREYGDAALLVQRAMGGVLGDQVQVVVDGADDHIPDTPQIGPAPVPPGDAATPLERRIHQIATTRWETESAARVDEWEHAITAQPGLAARQAWLRDWAETEFLTGKIVEGETDTVGLGDGVYRLGWSNEHGRPIVEVFDPGMYFPVIDDDIHGYPTKVHLAWEFEDGGKRWVRRLTWELTTITAALWNPDLGDFPRDANGQLVLPAGDSIDRDGRIVRTYPWADTPTDVTCVFSDGTWMIGDLGRDPHLADLDETKAQWAFTDDGQQAHRLDLRHDFIPIVHIPNTPSTRDHFGRSILDIVAQILDDLHAADTDVRAAAELAAGPVVALKGGVAGTGVAAAALSDGWVSPPNTDPTAVDNTRRPSPNRQVRVAPGTVWNLPDNGGMDVLDMSTGLTSVRAEREDLMRRLSVNAQVPAEVLGRVDVADVPSGVALALSFGPFEQLVNLMRLTREPKLALLLKMVQRLAQVGGILDPGPTPTARVVFGAYLPSDLTAAVQQVVALLQAHGVSRATALRILVAAGVDVDDAAAELDRIAAEDTESAVQVADATGSEQLAADRLGVTLPEPAVVAAPAITLPVP